MKQIGNKGRGHTQKASDTGACDPTSDSTGSYGFFRGWALEVVMAEDDTPRC